MLPPGGRLLASGLVTNQARRVADAMRRHGFVDIEEERIGDWVLLVGVRSANVGAAQG